MTQTRPKLQQVSLEKACHILEGLTVTDHIDTGMVETFQGVHLMLGHLILIKDNSTGDGVLIRL